MLIFFSILVLSISIFLGLFFIAKSIKGKSTIIINYYNENYIDGCDTNYDYDSYDDEDYDEDNENDEDYEMFSKPDDDTMIFVFEDINSIFDFMKGNNFVVDNSKIGEYNGMYFIDLSYLPKEKQKNIRPVVWEWLGQEVRDIKIANYLRDWLYTK